MALHYCQPLGISTKGKLSVDIIKNIDNRFSQSYKLRTLNHPDIIEAFRRTTDRINLNGQLHLLHRARMIKPDLLIVKGKTSFGVIASDIFDAR